MEAATPQCRSHTDQDNQDETEAPDLGDIFRLFPVPTLVLSRSHRISQASQSLLDIWGLSLDACAGRGLLELLGQQSLLRPGPDEGRLSQSLAEAVTSRSVRKTDPFYSANGGSWAVQVTAIFEADQLLSFVLIWDQLSSGGPSGLDLSGDALATDEAFRILVEAVKDYAIFLLDTTGHITTWNTGAQLNKGYTRDEIVGKHFSIFYGEEDLKAGKPEWELEVCRRDGRVEDEGWRYRKDGTRFWANVIITAMTDRNGVLVGFGKVTRDLTERKANEWRLISAYEEAAKLKSDFLANMSHE